MNTTEATSTVIGSKPSQEVSRKTQPGPLPNWMVRVCREWALDTYRARPV
jgi:hypothetical protein